MLLDINYLEIEKYFTNQFDRSLVNIPLDDIIHINKMLENDAKFLARMQLMDYSLLLVIEEAEKNSQKMNEDGNKSRNIFLSSNRKLYYHIGVIDYL